MSNKIRVLMYRVSAYVMHCHSNSNDITELAKITVSTFLNRPDADGFIRAMNSGKVYDTLPLYIDLKAVITAMHPDKELIFTFTVESTS